MDDENDDNNTTGHCNVAAESIVVIGELDNSTSDHTVMVDPDQLIGPQVIDMIMNKPEFSFLIRYYSLLYQSLIPNCKLTLHTLRQHISISDNIEQYIVGAASHRTSCQRLINFLLTRLYSEKDYMQFCYHLNIISVMTDLPYRLIAEFRTNGSWECNVPQVHPGLSLHQTETNNLHNTGTMDFSIEARNFSALSGTLDAYNEATNGRAIRCCVSSLYHHRKRYPSLHTAATDKHSSNFQQEIKKFDVEELPVSVSSNVDTMNLSFLLCSSDWNLVERFLGSLCSVLPHNYQLTIDKLKTIPQLLKNGGEQLSKLISSSSADVRKINEKIITYLIVKLCYNDNDTSLVRLCDVMDESIASNETPACLQEIRYASTDVPSSCSTVTQRSSITTPVSMEYSQHNILSQPSSCVTIVSDTHTTFSCSPVTIFSVVECLTTSSSVVTSISGQVITTVTTTADVASQMARAEEYTVPQNLNVNTDFTQLKAHYHTILHLMPDDYELTVGKLVNCISDDQICTILSSSNSTVANKIILDCLIERMRCREELLDLCDQLESISTSQDLSTVINEIRFGVQQSIQFPAVTAIAHLQLSHNLSVSHTTATAISATSSSAVHNSATFYEPNPSVNLSFAPFSNRELQAKLRYEERRQQRGFKYLQPPPLLSTHVNREILLDEIVTKLLNDTVDCNRYEITLTITGAGGFGKTTTVIALCQHHAVKNWFTDGFVFIELGPQATDPDIKLRGIYNLLTDEQCDINVVQQKILQLTRDYYHNLLVIIDDVWHVEDAEPLVKAFSNCKTILTTRMNDIEQYIPSRQTVHIGPMTQDEAISLLTREVIDKNQLSQEDLNLLNVLAEDVHLWPLLLSLIRGQLSHNLKNCHMSYHKAIQNIQTKLYHKGLTAFDKNTIENMNKSRKLAVNACIQVTLELLTKPLSDKIKKLIVWTGIGTSLETAVLHILWTMSKPEAEYTVNVLWGYGLVQFTNINCVEVHNVISQYIIECMDSMEVTLLSPITGRNETVQQVSAALIREFQLSCGIQDLSSLTSIDYLKYKLSESENVVIPFYFKTLSVYTVTDPHSIILTLQQIKEDLMTSPCTINLLALFDDDINALINNCKQILREAHKLCRKLNQTGQRCLYEKNFDKLMQAIQEFIINYPLCNVAQKAAAVVKKILPYYCGHEELLHHMTIQCENLQMRTKDYHSITTLTLPHIELLIKHHELITTSLLNGPPDTELTYLWIIGGNLEEEFYLLNFDRLIKVQEVAPNIANIIAKKTQLH